MTQNSINKNSEPSLDPEELDDAEPDPIRPGLVSAGENNACFCWQLICPPKNWQNPVPVELTEVRLLEIISQRLNLVVTRDDKRKKIYLGTALGLMEPEPTDPKAPARSGLRFPTGWTADVIPNDQAGSEYEVIDVEAAAPLIAAFPDAQVSKNFRLSEFRPGGYPLVGLGASYDLIRLSPMLVNTLEEIRKRAGDQPLHITSGYRPPAYNRKVGGVSNSTHIDGLAADIYSDYLNTDELYAICDQIIGDRGGVGYYQSEGFVHIDLRGYRSRW